MIKYIKVDWPEYQKFEEHDRINECYTCKVYGENDIFSLMVPEDLYYEVVYKKTLPFVYKDEDLGIIKCYEDRAILNNTEVFVYDRYLEKGNKLLVYNHNSKKWKIVNCVSAAKGFPILTDDKEVFIGLTDELVGSHG